MQLSAPTLYKSCKCSWLLSQRYLRNLGHIGGSKALKQQCHWSVTTVADRGETLEAASGLGLESCRGGKKGKGIPGHGKGRAQAERDSWAWVLKKELSTDMA